jgi:protein-S-isoprenylcysteine O-methyltransferase Ste14
VIAAFGLIGLLDAYLPAYTDRKEFWTFDGDAIRWLGVVLFAAGGALRIWPVFVLGRRFSGLVAIQPGHTLVTTGLYSVVRHPSYLGLLVNSLGWALAFRSGVGVLLAALLIPPLLARIHAEEKLLRSQFGREYEVYRSRTSRLIPGSIRRVGAKHAVGRQRNKHSLLADIGKRRGFQCISASVREHCEFSGIVHRYITMELSAKVALRRRWKRLILKTVNFGSTGSRAADHSAVDHHLCIRHVAGGPHLRYLAPPAPDGLEWRDDAAARIAPS